MTTNCRTGNYRFVSYGAAPYEGVFFLVERWLNDDDSLPPVRSRGKFMSYPYVSAYF